MAGLRGARGGPLRGLCDARLWRARQAADLSGQQRHHRWLHQDRIVFASDVSQPFRYDIWLHTVDLEGNEPQVLALGPAQAASWGDEGMVIGPIPATRRGGTLSWRHRRRIWIDEQGTGDFDKLIELPGNLANPMWMGQRVYFVSDHGGVGNVYSCTPEGKDLRQHTDHQEFYARNATTDGRRIVYHAGADIYVLDPAVRESHKVEIEYHSPQVQRSRKFAEPAKYLEDYALSYDGSRLALVNRGQTFTMGNWEGPVLQHGIRNGVRYRLTRWLNDGKRVVLVSDEGGQDHLEVHHLEGSIGPRSYSDLDVGRPRRSGYLPPRTKLP